MPTSAEGPRQEVIQYIAETIKPKSILDVGPGEGTYYHALTPVYKPERFDALEVFPKYVRDFRLNKLYNTVHIGNMLDWRDYDYDLVIFGDVMEHVYKEQAVDLWGIVKEQARWAIIACPVVEWPQGEMWGNIHEAHLHHYDEQEIAETFGEPVWSKRVDAVASFIFRFEENE